MKPEKTWDEAMESVYKIMLEEWSKEEIIEYLRCRDGYTKNDMTALPIKEFKCKDVYGQEYVLSYTDAPMVEYAPVVRCKDCKWWDKVDNIDGVNYGTCERKCTAIRKDAIPNENWFCADGERKE